MDFNRLEVLVFPTFPTIFDYLEVSSIPDYPDQVDCLHSASIIYIRTQLLATTVARPRLYSPRPPRSFRLSYPPGRLTVPSARKHCRLHSPGHDCYRPATTTFARLQLLSPDRPGASTSTVNGEPSCLATCLLDPTTREKDPRYRPNSPATSRLATSRPACCPTWPVTPTTAFNSPAYSPVHTPAHRPYHTAKKDLLALRLVLRHLEQGHTASLSGRLSPIVPHSTT